MNLWNLGEIVVDGTTNAKMLVALYAKQMQIEHTFFVCKLECRVKALAQTEQRQ